MAGSIVTNTLTLKPGSNAFIAVSGPGIPTSQAHALLASELGAGIGSQPLYLGERLSYTHWAIGDARPVVLRNLPATQPTLDWYARMGAPVGPSPAFYTVNIDWRGSERTITWPAGIFVLPAKARVVRGAPNYNDGTPEELSQELAAAKLDERVSSLGGQVGSLLESIGSDLGTFGQSLIWAIGGGVTFYILTRLFR